MEPFRRVTGRMAPLDRADVDTDQIMPKQFLKRIERSGFGPFIFHDWRARGDFVLDRPAYHGAVVLVTGANFGCGSSREHAPWGLQDAGFRALIAPSFADIFFGNCIKIGLLPVVLGAADVRVLMDLATQKPDAEVTVDLQTQAVRAAGFSAGFDLDAFARTCLLEGLDEVGLSLRKEGAIAAFEARRAPYLPRVG